MPNKKNPSKGKSGNRNPVNNNNLVTRGNDINSSINKNKLGTFNEEEGALRGVNYRDPVVRHRTQKIYGNLKKINGKNFRIDETFLTDTFYIHFQPMPWLKSEVEVPPEKMIPYQLVKDAFYSKVVEQNRKYSVANTEVSSVLTISYTQNLIDELKKALQNSQSQEERQMAQQILEQLTGMQGQQQNDNQEGKQQQQEGNQQQNNNQEGNQQQQNQSENQQKNNQGGKQKCKAQQNGQGMNCNSPNMENGTSELTEGDEENSGQQSQNKQQTGQGSSKKRKGKQGGQQNSNKLSTNRGITELPLKGLPQGSQNDQKMQKFISELNKKALSKALEDAKTVSQIQQVAGGNTAGTGSSIRFGADIGEVIELARNTEIKNILKLLEGVPKVGSDSKKKDSPHSKGEIAGYTVGSDLERIVPSELALPDEALDIKLAESQVLLYEKRIKERWGPIYLLLDKSGSMDGEKAVWAKAVALSLYKRARKENREFYIRFFDYEPYEMLKIPKNPRPKDAIKMIEYIGKVNATGGTDISKAIITATRDIMEGHVKGVSEIIIITDGEDNINLENVKNAIKNAKAKVLSVMIQGNNPDLKKISNKYLTVERLDEQDLLNVVETKVTGDES